MIHITVATGYLRRVLSGRGTAIDKALADLIRELEDRHFKSVEIAEKLKGVSVFDVLIEYHASLGKLLEQKEPILELLKSELCHAAAAAYQQPSFETTARHARDLLALHGPLPHGTIPGGTSAFLPDMASGVRLFGSLIFKMRIAPSGAPVPQAIVSTSVRSAELECHLCDDLFAVYNRAKVFSSKFAEVEDLPGSPLAITIEDTLVIDPDFHGFWGYRSLQRAFPSVPAIANHFRLAASALRQGLAKPIISGIIPNELWRQLDDPVRHFLLDAAELVGGNYIKPLHPSIPNAKTMDKLCIALANEDRPSRADIPKHFSDLAEQDNDLALKQLGLDEAIWKAMHQFSDREQKGEWVWDYRSAVLEVRNSLFGLDVEQSLSLEYVLNLYPLHKRVLGLIEYIILPKLKGLGFGGRASQLWTDAFLTRPLYRHPWKGSLGRLATLETEGNWLIHAGQLAGGGTGAIDLSILLDAIVNRMSSANEVRGITINLQPATPAAHARQLAALADQNDDAACVTLYLGKIALMLRNAIEHGTDRVIEKGLLVDIAGYWKEERGRKRETAFDWVVNRATDVSWRFKASLPTSLPKEAEAFLLTAASLHRCLVLISLVMHGAVKQLGI